MSQDDDLLGDELEVTSDALAPDDELDEGLVALLTPEDATLDEDTEDDAAFAALREDLSPGEAQRVVDTMRPLSEDEREILDETPGLDDLRKVDDPAEEEWLAERLNDGYQAMDKVLEDKIYGDIMDHEEELERTGLDSDIGLSWKSLKRRASKAWKTTKKGLKPLDPRWQYKKAKGALKLVKKFVPSRDKQKAKMVKSLNARLVREHANWLAIQDQRAGRPLKSRSMYTSMAKLWSKKKLRAGGLPTKFAVSGADVLGADMLGSDVMGAWWNPLSWFHEKSQIIVNQTQGERSAVGPGGQPMDPSQMDPGDQEAYSEEAYADESYPREAYADESYSEEAYPDYAYGDDLEAGISGEDSLGAFATEILSGAAAEPETKKRPAPGAREDELVQIAEQKLGSGQALRAGEVGVLATLARSGHPRAKKIFALLMKEGTAVSNAAGDESGAWMYMLNPVNWFKSSKERTLKSKEIDAWKRNAELQKQLKKREQVLAQAQRAKTAAEAVEAARSQAAATEAQLKEIEASLSGALFPADASGFEAFVGHEKPTAVAEVIKRALDKLGKRKRAGELYAKISRGEKLDKGEIADAKKIAVLLTKVKVVHGDLREETPPELTMLHGAFVGACLAGAIEDARKRNARDGKVANVLSRKIAAGQPLSPEEKKLVLSLLVDLDKTREIAKAVVSGRALRGLEQATGLRRAAFVGAAKAAMTPVEKKMLSSIVNLAKAGNPRAQKALDDLRKTGTIMGGDHVGLSLSSAFKYATMPITLPAKHLYKAAKWTGKKLGIVKSKASPEKVRLSKMKAAAKRRSAAMARARAADAQTAAELRAQESIADAAEAEADAADAAALAQEAAMRTKEIEADPEQAYAADEEDSSGEFVGSWTPYVGAVRPVITKLPDSPPSVSAPAAKKSVGKKPAGKKMTKEQVSRLPDPFDPGSPEMKRAAQDKKIVAKAAEKSATGKKIRAGAALYKKAKAGNPEAKKAIETMVARAKAGDQQAARDTRAVQAGRRAVLAKQKAQKREAAVLASRARKARVIAVQKKLEAAVAGKLAKVERKVELRKLARVERKAAAGNKAAIAYVKKQVAAAKKGDKRAAGKVAKLQLAKTVRKAAPTARERRNLRIASRVYKKAAGGNPRAVRQVMVVEAAAKKGNPNAKRAVARLKTAKMVYDITEPVVITASLSVREEAARGRDRQAALLATAEKKAASGTASREELAAGARAAQALGDRKTAGELAVAASRAPSSTEVLKKTATVVTAKELGNPEAKKTVAVAFEQAKAGDPNAIRKMGNVVAVQTIDDVKKGRPVPEAMRDAVNIQARVAAGDPAAVEVVRQVSEAATGPSPTAVATAAAITMSAAAITARAMAAKPRARAEYLEKVNAVPPEEKPAAERALAEGLERAKQGTITAEEGVVAVRLAERLGKPKVAAKIAAMAPPPPPSTAMSSLPDAPLGPITGKVSLIKESLLAILLATRDPVANYREGITSRARAQAPAPLATTLGWSPWSFFRAFARSAPIIAPATAMLASAASLAMAIDRKKKPKAAPAVQAAVPAPSPAAPADRPTSAEPPAGVVESSAQSEGDEDDILAPTFERPKKKAIRARAADEDGVLPPDPGSRSKKDRPASSLGAEKTFRDHVVAALKDKKMTRRDFNRTVALQAGAGASDAKKKAIGASVLAFLAKKSIKITEA